MSSPKMQHTPWRHWLRRRQVLVGALAAAFLGRGAAVASGTAAAPVRISLLGRATPSSAVLQVRASAAVRIYIEYGYSATALTKRTATVRVAAGAVRAITLRDLQAGATVHFRLRYALGASPIFRALAAARFATAPAADGYVFAIQADPHMDDNSSATVYRNTLAQVVASAPAFLMDLGDIFMTDKLPDKSESNIRARFELMKGYYDLLGDIPLRITLGNHDGENGYDPFNTKRYRAEYFPEQTGDLAYFAFTGPDCLFIVLDPFTYTTENPKADGWAWTLGRTQYDWLVRTLEQSGARHRFVFIHHLLVGDAASRGGVEIASRNEWGGNNVDGSYGFDDHRPGWGRPIHQLLRDHGVDFVFKGHDHLYVKQELDGIVYQTLPQPSHPGDKVDPLQYGYRTGTAKGGSGFLRVTARTDGVHVEFVKHDGSIIDNYTRSA